MSLRCPEPVKGRTARVVAGELRRTIPLRAKATLVSHLPGILMIKLYTKSSNMKLLVMEQARIKLNNLILYQIFSKFSNLSKFLSFLPHYAAFV